MNHSSRTRVLALGLVAAIALVAAISTLWRPSTPVAPPTHVPATASPSAADGGGARAQEGAAADPGREVVDVPRAAAQATVCGSCSVFEGGPLAACRVTIDSYPKARSA